jgi:cbb3-type cytochrome c oxidase subunit III
MKITSRTFEYLAGILATTLLAAGLLWYAVNEPDRINLANETQVLSDLEGAMTLYAENCAVCHGLAAEGIGATPGLNNPGLAGMSSDELFKVISRGRFETAMPAWGLEDGGPLSDYQINTLVTLIQQGDWQATRDRVVNLGMAPLVPFAARVDAALLEQVAALPEGGQLSLGITVFAENCVACHGADGLGTSLAPALNDPMVKQKDPTELERIVSTGVPSTLMAGWQKVLSAEEIAGVIGLLLHWDQVPVGAIPEPDQPVAVTAESLALGADLYSQTCTRCHGPTGQGTQRAPALNVKGFLTTTNDIAMQQIITLGVPGTAMPAWGDRMPEEQIQAILGFIRAWEANAPDVAQPIRRGGPWWRNSNNSVAALPSGGIAGEVQVPPLADPQAKIQPTTPPAATGQNVNQAHGPGPGTGSGQGHILANQPVSGQPNFNWPVLAFTSLLVLAGFILFGIAVNRLWRLPTQS